MSDVNTINERCKIIIEDPASELARLRAENEAFRDEKKKNLRLKVSEKGAVSLYGVRRFPVTFYKNEWQTIIGMIPEIQQFVSDNDHQLTTKK
tara:strand:+ start:2204 stop:2482 length:279 start_codon:yes stop_codon:yes gene_type:complete